jgi:hypothetical protein
MYVRDLKPLKRWFLVRYSARQAELECRRCGRRWTTTRTNAREPRRFWPAEQPGRGRPATAAELVRHWALPHSRS